jgi:hypothetical protein
MEKEDAAGGQAGSSFWLDEAPPLLRTAALASAVASLEAHVAPPLWLTAAAPNFNFSPSFSLDAPLAVSPPASFAIAPSHAPSQRHARLGVAPPRHVDSSRCAAAARNKE